ncbi:MAG: NUDIX hydrolase, partial [Pseudomonas alloputida]
TLECYYRDRIGQHYPIGHEYLPPMNVSPHT